MLRWLLFQKEDMILVAKTCFGKSIILQVILCFHWGFIVIVILLLNAIGTEQKNKTKELLSTCPVHICFKTISAVMLDNICIGKYTHILLSPELLSGKKFYDILTSPTFYVHVGLVVVNKVYLVANWGRSF